MLVTINNENKQVNVTIQGGTMTVELERGNFVLEDAVNTECDRDRRGLCPPVA